jgi:hypothetical protein
MMNWKGYGKKRLWPNLSHCPVMFLEGLRKATTNFSQGNVSQPRFEWGS